MIGSGRACRLLTRATLGVVLGASPAIAETPNPALEARAIEATALEARAIEATAIEITATVEPLEARVGERIRYEIRVEAPASLEVEIPAFGERLGDLDVVGGSESREDHGTTRVLLRRHELVAWEPGTHEIPGPTLLVAGRDERPVVPDRTVTVLDPLADDGPRDERGDPELRDIVDPVPFAPTGWVWGGMLLAAVIALALAGLLAHLRDRRERARETHPPRHHPDHLALEGLSDLENLRLLEQGLHEAHWVELTRILRSWVEARFGLRAPERTTEEFLAEARHDERLGTDVRSRLGGFLVAGDLVKFARHVPPPEEGRNAVHAAREVVRAAARDDEARAHEEDSRALP